MRLHRLHEASTTIVRSSTQLRRFDVNVQHVPEKLLKPLLSLLHPAVGYCGITALLTVSCYAQGYTQNPSNFFCEEHRPSCPGGTPHINPDVQLSYTHTLLMA